MSEPTLEKVVESIEILNNLKSGNINEASLFLTELQKSSSAWFIADQLLYMNKDLYTSYFAAQTMRTKIQLHFEELPVESHLSLKESLIKHLLASNSSTNVTVTKQLCLAIADLFCHMVQWKNSLQEIIHTFSQTIESAYLLLDVLKYIPEEFNNKSLRLGINRKTEIYGELEYCRLTVISVLDRCLTLQTDVALTATLNSLNAWYALKVFRDNDLQESSLITLVYQVLERPGDVSENLFKAAVQCAADFFAYNVYRVPMLTHIYQEQTYKLEDAYHQCEVSRPDYCLEYAKIFCDMASAMLPDILTCPRFDGSGDFSDIRSLYMLLMTSRTNRECCSYVLDVLMDVTDHTSSSSSEDTRSKLTPIFEELVGIMTNHCAVSDTNEEQSLSDFRADVFIVMEQIRMFLDVDPLFKRMLTKLSQLLSQTDSQSVYNEAEAILCMVSSLVKFVDTNSEENALWTEQLLTTVILPNISRSQPSFQSVCFTMFSELCRWSSDRPHIMDAMIREMNSYIINCNFDEHDELQMNALSSAMRCISIFCKRHPERMIEQYHWDLVIEVCSHLTRLPFVLVKEMVEIYESVGKTLCYIAMEDKGHSQDLADGLGQKLWNLCKINFDVLHGINETSSSKQHPNNPCIWLDNVSSVFLSMSKLTTVNNIVVSRFYTVIDQYVWPVISKLIEKYLMNGHVLERVVRILRYVLRSFKSLTKPLLANIANIIVAAYSHSQESCFIYVTGILVDEFGEDEDCRSGLIQTFQSISITALTILQGDGLLNDPHTTEDFFRLTVRLVQHCSSLFLSQPQLQLPQLLDMALRALSSSSMKLDTKMLALRFLVETLECANTDAPHSSKTRTVTWLLQENGLNRLLYTSLFLCRWNSDEVLDEDLASDMAQIIVNVRKLVLDQALFVNTLDSAILQVGLSRQDGLLYVTEDQKAQFRSSLLQDKLVLRGIEEFAKLFT